MEKDGDKSAWARAAFAGEGKRAIPEARSIPGAVVSNSGEREASERTTGISGEWGKGSGRKMGDAIGGRRAVVLGVATVGNRSDPSGAQIQLWVGREAMLESQGGGTKRTVECMGVCNISVSGIQDMGFGRRAGGTDTVVARGTAVVIEQFVESLPCSMVGRACFL